MSWWPRNRRRKSPDLPPPAYRPPSDRPRRTEREHRQEAHDVARISLAIGRGDFGDITARPIDIDTVWLGQKVPPGQQRIPRARVHAALEAMARRGVLVPVLVDSRWGSTWAYTLNPDHLR